MKLAIATLISFSSLLFAEIVPDPSLVPFSAGDVDATAEARTDCPNFAGVWKGSSDAEPEKEFTASVIQETREWEAKCSKITIREWRNGQTWLIDGHYDISYSGIPAGNPDARYQWRQSTYSKWVGKKIESLTHFNFFMANGAGPAGGGSWKEVIWLDKEGRLKINYKSDTQDVTYTFKRVEE